MSEAKWDLIIGAALCSLRDASDSGKGCNEDHFETALRVRLQALTHPVDAVVAPSEAGMRGAFVEGYVEGLRAALQPKGDYVPVAQGRMDAEALWQERWGQHFPAPPGWASAEQVREVAVAVKSEAVSRVIADREMAVTRVAAIDLHALIARVLGPKGDE